MLNYLGWQSLNPKPIGDLIHTPWADSVCVERWLRQMKRRSRSWVTDNLSVHFAYMFVAYTGASHPPQLFSKHVPAWCSVSLHVKEFVSKPVFFHRWLQIQAHTFSAAACSNSLSLSCDRGRTPNTTAPGTNLYNCIATLCY